MSVDCEGKSSTGVHALTDARTTLPLPLGAISTATLEDEDFSCRALLMFDDDPLLRLSECLDLHAVEIGLDLMQGDHSVSELGPEHL